MGLFKKIKKAFKKVAKKVTKVFKKVVKFVKKYWKEIAVAALVVFTAGAAMGFFGAGNITGWAGVSTAFSNAGYVATGGAIGSSTAQSVLAAQAVAGAAAEGVVLASAGGVGAGGVGTAATGLTTGEAMLASTGVTMAGGGIQSYQAGKAEEKAEKDAEKERLGKSFYGVDGYGNKVDGADQPTTPDVLNPGGLMDTPQVAAAPQVNVSPTGMMQTGGVAPIQPQSQQQGPPQNIDDIIKMRDSGALPSPSYA